MSTFMIRNIRMTLDPKSIGKAIAEIEEIERNIKPAMELLINELARKGTDIAKAELIFFDDPAYYTGQLSDSVAYQKYDGDSAVVYTDCPYAVFVEYGTGVYGADINDHGWAGWYYRNDRDGKIHWTCGMPPRPFMHNTYEDLIAEAEAAGGRIVAEYLA